MNPELIRACQNVAAKTWRTYDLLQDPSRRAEAQVYTAISYAHIREMMGINSYPER